MFKKIVVLTAFIFLSASPSVAAVKSDRFSGEASVLNAATLKVGLRTVTLWGIKPVKIENSVTQLRSSELLESLANSGIVSCKIVKDNFPKATARCISSKDVDLGLALINEGLAVVDKEQLDSSEFSKIYLEAQHKARVRLAGVWGYLDAEKKKDFINEIVSNLVSNQNLWVAALGVAGLLFLTIIFSLVWIKRALSAQKDEIEKIYFKEYLLKAKEKGVIISLVRGELEENKNKLNAFIKLYIDMLEDIKSDKREEVLAVTGESLKRSPLLKRKVFDLNFNKLPMLDMTVANKLTKLYDSFIAEEEYVEIGKGFSVEMIKNFIKDSIKGAKSAILDIDKAINLLDAEYMSILDFVGKHGASPKDAPKKKKSKK